VTAEPDDIQLKTARLSDVVSGLGRTVVAFSGGVDSSLLAVFALRTLGGANMLTVTAVSESFSNRDRGFVERVVKQFGLPHRFIRTHELDAPDFADNPPTRCYACKRDLFLRLTDLARGEGFDSVADGSTRDDLGDYRPGRAAARELGVRSPLVEAGFTKADVRRLSCEMGLPEPDRPSSPCLASRIPYFTKITAERLRRIEASEEFLRSLGFEVVRVRDYKTIARIEVAPERIESLLSADVFADVEAELIRLGYERVEVDPRGFRSGSLNDALSLGVNEEAPPRRL
jgi:uncharacterized protein